KRLRGEHVDFVNDVDLVARPAGPILHIAPNLAHLIDAAIAGPVDLEHVYILAGCDTQAAVAGIARRRGRSVDAIERLCEDARRGSFADAARAGEQIGVRDAITFQGIDERLSDRFLTDEIAELLRPIATGEDGIPFVRFMIFDFRLTICCHTLYFRSRGSN